MESPFYCTGDDVTLFLSTYITLRENTALISLVLGWYAYKFSENKLKHNYVFPDRPLKLFGMNSKLTGAFVSKMTLDAYPGWCRLLEI